MSDETGETWTCAGCGTEWIPMVCMRTRCKYFRQRIEKPPETGEMWTCAGCRTVYLRSSKGGCSTYSCKNWHQRIEKPPEPDEGPVGYKSIATSTPWLGEEGMVLVKKDRLAAYQKLEEAAERVVSGYMDGPFGGTMASLKQAQANLRKALAGLRGSEGSDGESKER